MAVCRRLYSVRARPLASSWIGPHQTGHAAWLTDCCAMNSRGEHMRKPEWCGAHPHRAVRRMGHPALALHDPGSHQRRQRYCRRQALGSASLTRRPNPQRITALLHHAMGHDPYAKAHRAYGTWGSVLERKPERWSEIPRTGGGGATGYKLERPLARFRAASREIRGAARARAKSCVPVRTKAKLADGVGFEPTRRFHVYTLSRRAPSTTRPPVQRSGDPLPDPCRDTTPSARPERTIGWRPAEFDPYCSVARRAVFAGVSLAPASAPRLADDGV